MVLAILALLCAVALPPARRLLDGAAVHAARDEIAAVLGDARRRARWRGERTDVLFAGDGTVRVVAGRDTVLVRRVGEVRGVRVAANRATIGYTPTGLGYGAANATIVVSRGAAADTLTLSRLGRVRW